jgi:hypothetical protein
MPLCWIPAYAGMTHFAAGMTHFAVVATHRSKWLTALGATPNSLAVPFPALPLQLDAEL